MRKHMRWVAAGAAALCPGVLPVSSAVAAPGDCTPTGYSPTTVVVGLSEVSRTFSVQACDDMATWSITLVGDAEALATDRSPGATVSVPDSNLAAGPGDVSVGATGTTSPAGTLSLTDGFAVQRRTSFGSFNAAPEPVVKGKVITLKATLKRVDWDTGKYAGYSGRTVDVQFRPSGGGYGHVKYAKTTSGGRFSTTVKASKTGVWRLAYAGSSASGPATSPSDGVIVAPTSLTKDFANCTDMHKYYPHGVGKPGARDKGGSVTTFFVSNTLYNVNSESDRDRDKIACEKA